MLFFKKRERNRVENRPSIYPECLNDFFPFLYMSCMDFLLLVLLDLACPPVGHYVTRASLPFVLLLIFCLVFLRNMVFSPLPDQSLITTHTQQ